MSRAAALDWELPCSAGVLSVLISGNDLILDFGALSFAGVGYALGDIIYHINDLVCS